jgi:hypothetical protein
MTPASIATGPSTGNEARPTLFSTGSPGVLLRQRLSAWVAPPALATLAFFLAGLLGGCGPRSGAEAWCVDPTDDCNWSVVVVRNDTPALLSLRACIHRCDPSDHRLDPLRLATGEATPKKQYGGVYANVGELSWWAVEARDGKRSAVWCSTAIPTSATATSYSRRRRARAHTISGQRSRSAKPPWRRPD